MDSYRLCVEQDKLFTDIIIIKIIPLCANIHRKINLKMVNIVMEQTLFMLENNYPVGNRSYYGNEEYPVIGVHIEVKLGQWKSILGI